MVVNIFMTVTARVVMHVVACDQHCRQHTGVSVCGGHHRRREMCELSTIIFCLKLATTFCGQVVMSTRVVNKCVH